MLSVTFHAIDSQTGPMVFGELRWDGKAFSVSKDSEAGLINVTQDPIRPLGMNRWVFPDKEPELFMRSLYLWYHGSYFRCDMAVET